MCAFDGSVRGLAGCRRGGLRRASLASVSGLEAVSGRCLAPLCPTSAAGGELPVYERAWFTHLSIRRNEKTDLEFRWEDGHPNLERR